MCQAMQVSQVRAAERERSARTGRTANEQHALAGRAWALLPTVGLRALPVAEQRPQDAPVRACALVRGQPLEVLLEEREQRFVCGRINRVVEEQIGRVLVARRTAREAFPDQLPVLARVLCAD